MPLPWTAERLPDALSQRCVDLLGSYGLTFGAFDFVVTPDGRCVFLELNPNGQWMFVQDLVPELKLTQCDPHRTHAPQ